MITESIVRGLLGVLAFLDSLVPPIAWPEWLSMPTNYLTSNLGAGSINLNALFVWIHPTTIDIMALTILLLSIERLVRRARAVVSTATGGGGIHT